MFLNDLFLAFSTHQIFINYYQLLHIYLQLILFCFDIALTNQQKKIGQYSIILSHIQPSKKILQKYDWLDTMKKNGGTIFFRFLLPDGVVVRPKATVVKFHDIHMYEQNI